MVKMQLWVRIVATVTHRVDYEASLALVSCRIGTRLCSWAGTTTDNVLLKAPLFIGLHSRLKSSQDTDSVENSGSISSLRTNALSLFSSLIDA